MTNTPLACLRQDIEAIEYAPGLVAFYDPDAAASSIVDRIPLWLANLCIGMNRSTTLLDLVQCAAAAGKPLVAEDLVTLFRLLDEAHLLDSQQYRLWHRDQERAFNDLATRPAAHAGESYPQDPVELRRMLDGFLAADRSNASGSGEPLAVIAPHIDFRVGGESYAPAYNALRLSTADTFIIFGTSHRLSYDAFMIAEKDFETPLGIMPTDRELIAQFRSALPFEITRNEIAHRREHSIEFQTVFLRHILGDRPARIVPILTGSLHNYVESGEGNAKNDPRLTTLYNTLERTVSEMRRRVCYIAGADMSHIGRKFDDPVPASDLLDAARRIDSAALDAVVRADAEGFIRVLASEHNRYRVCGTAPIYATLRTARPTRGELFCHDTWNETERESAVTFASVGLYGAG